MSRRFAWDPRKDESNATKHGISFTEAGTVFEDPLSLTRPDPDHSSLERRYLTLGQSRSLKLLVVAHCDRRDTIRIISARPAERQERRRYETGGWIA